MSINLKEFEAYLMAHKDTVFLKGNCSNCPLASFLNFKHGETLYTVGIANAYRDNILFESLPNWAYAFRRKFDEGEDSRATGEEALKVLERCSQI